MPVVTIELPSLLRNVLDGQPTLSVEAATLSEAFDAIRSTHPQLAVHLFDEGGGLRQHVLCFHNDENTRWLDDHAVDLAEGDRLTIIQAVSGG